MTNLFSASVEISSKIPSTSDWKMSVLWSLLGQGNPNWGPSERKFDISWGVSTLEIFLKHLLLSLKLCLLFEFYCLILLNLKLNVFLAYFQIHYLPNIILTWSINFLFLEMLLQVISISTDTTFLLVLSIKLSILIKKCMLPVENNMSCKFLVALCNCFRSVFDNRQRSRNNRLLRFFASCWSVICPLFHNFCCVSSISVTNMLLKTDRSVVKDCLSLYGINNRNWLSDVRSNSFSELFFLASEYFVRIYFQRQESTAKSNKTQLTIISNLSNKYNLHN